MKIRHKEIEIKKESPFAECKLDRVKYANVLTQIVNTYADGFVLAINNEWGTGKTTFVKMWQQALKNEGFQTIYFNAWENDFDNNPIVALMSELKTLTNNKNNEVFKSIIEKGAILAKNVLPTLVKSVANKYIDFEMVNDAIENVTKGTTEILEKEINEYITKKKTVLEFKEFLEKYIKSTETEKPLIFIIDELDRCRPDYAVEVLEQIKHFFSVSGIVYVLSIDKNHLASSIKGYYGSECINTDEYLRRFIDLEYSIPKPSTKIFCEYLYNYYSFADFFSSDERKKYQVFQNDAEYLLKMSEILFNKSNSTLRQQEKMFALTRLILSSFQSTKHTFSNLLFFLIFIKTMKNQVYKKIRDNGYSLQELCEVFDELMYSDSENEYNNRELLYIESLLLYLYYKNQGCQNKEKLFDSDNNGKKICLVKSKFDNETEEQSLSSFMNYIYGQSTFHDLTLNYLLDKIDLIQHINK